MLFVIIHKIMMDQQQIVKTPKKSTRDLIDHKILFAPKKRKLTTSLNKCPNKNNHNINLYLNSLKKDFDLYINEIIELCDKVKKILNYQHHTEFEFLYEQLKDELQNLQMNSLCESPMDYILSILRKISYRANLQKFQENLKKGLQADNATNTKNELFNKSKSLWFLNINNDICQFVVCLI